MSWTEGSWCSYYAADGTRLDSFPATGRDESNLFEPRFSFVVASLVVASTVVGGGALVVTIWRTGRVIRRPRPVPSVPLAL